MSDLRAFFSPQAVAVLGVSRDPAKLGHRLLKNLADYGYAGSIYPVNPSGEPILGYPTLAQIADLPERLGQNRYLKSDPLGNVGSDH